MTLNSCEDVTELANLLLMEQGNVCVRRRMIEREGKEGYTLVVWDIKIEIDTL